ncbi:MAG: PHP domain-containing protein [Ruminococcaceae bacterium]|nr:PHP domain-containing protein [Oscillospiraceae bacterium]
MKIFASCHNHSCFSDANYTPEELVQIAHDLGHGGIILTDHDTVSGTYFINKAARKLGMKSILGCEFSTYYQGVPFHLLGFDFNPEHPKMKKLLEYLPSIQTSRSELMFKMGLERGSLREGVTWQEIRDAFPYNDYVCNNQVFEVMVKKGIYQPEEYEEVFFKPNFSSKLGLGDYIREVTGKSSKNIHTEDVIRIIREAGGVPIVAHPAGKEEYAEKLIELGVMGFETRHSIFRPERGRGGEESRMFFEKLCEEKNLYKMGGSDHEGILGGYLEFGDEYACPEELSGILEEDFMKLYERRLG